jgi:sensor histidine kinase regulating citrate/malate metabolism
VGILPENLARVTQMGFSTKGEEGRGLGLHFFAVSLSAAGGELSVESEGVGKGATVTVRIKNA